MNLTQIKPIKKALHSRKRVGRGPGSGLGKTSGRDFNGQKSRSGYSRRYGFEGGQMPLQRRLPKFGFTNLKRVEYKAINLSTLDELAAKKELAAVDFEALVSAGFVSSNDKVKILGNGTLSKGLAVKAHAFSKSAEAAIVAAGGSVEKI